MARRTVLNSNPNYQKALRATDAMSLGGYQPKSEEDLQRGRIATQLLQTPSIENLLRRFNNTKDAAGEKGTDDWETFKKEKAEPEAYSKKPWARATIRQEGRRFHRPDKLSSGLRGQVLSKEDKAKLIDAVKKSSALPKTELIKKDSPTAKPLDDVKDEQKPKKKEAVDVINEGFKKISDKDTKEVK